MYNTPINHDIIQEDINKLLQWSNTWNLYFNVSKCKVLHMGKNNPKHIYTMDQGNTQVNVTECSEEKDLGVIFDAELKFDTHIQTAINKANKIIGIIRRTFSYLDNDSFKRFYKAVVRPHLEYGNIIWSSSNLKRHSKAVERVQRRATKLLPQLRDLPYETRLRILKLPSLKSGRLRGDLIQTYKIINHVDDVDVNSFFTMTHDLSTNKSNITRNSFQKIFHQPSSTNRSLFSFSHRVTSFWNSLPEHVKRAPDTNSFKTALDKQRIIINSCYEFD